MLWHKDKTWVTLTGSISSSKQWLEWPLKSHLPCEKKASHAQLASSTSLSFTLSVSLCFLGRSWAKSTNITVKTNSASTNGASVLIRHWIHSQAQQLCHFACLFAFMLQFYFYRSVPMSAFWPMVPNLVSWKCFSCFLFLGFSYLPVLFWYSKNLTFKDMIGW